MIPNPVSTEENTRFTNSPYYRYKLSPEDLTLIKTALASLNFTQKGKKKSNSGEILNKLEESRKRLLKKMEKRDYFMILYFEPKPESVELKTENFGVITNEKKGEETE